MRFPGGIQKLTSIEVEVKLWYVPFQVEEASGGTGVRLRGISWKVHLPITVI